MAHDYLMSILGRDLVAVGRLWRRVINQRMVFTGLPYAQWMVLDNLNRSGEGVNQKVVARRVGIERSAMVRVIKDMEEAGLLRRETPPDDNRTRHLVLTEKGRKHAKEISATARQFDDIVLAGFSTPDLHHLFTQLQIMRDRLSHLDEDA